MLKMGIITGFLSKTKDRFHEYNQPLELEGKLELMTQIEGYDGVELVYPYEVKDPKATKALLGKYNLNIAAVNVNVKAEPEFINGGLTSHDKNVRAKAVRFIKEAKDFAAAAGAESSSTVISSLIRATILSPIPYTFFSSSTFLNKPFSLRYLMIDSAFTGPIPGKSFNSSKLAVLILTTAAAEVVRKKIKNRVK